jgi:hypothetical protein
MDFGTFLIFQPRFFENPPARSVVVVEWVIGDLQMIARHDAYNEQEWVEHVLYHRVL